MRKSAWLWVGGAALGALWACSTDTFNGVDGGDAQTADVTNTDAISGGGDSSSGDVVIISPPWCSKQDAAFCADFDIPNDASAGFEPLTSSGPDTFGFQDAMVTSKPLGAVGVVPANSTTSVAFMPAITLNAAVAQMQLDLDIHLPDITGVSTPAIFAFALGAVPAANYMFGLAETGGKWGVAIENGSSPTDFPKQPPVTGGWFHAQLTITLGMGSSGSATLTLTDALDASNVYIAPYSNVATIPVVKSYPAAIQIGVSNASSSSPTTSLTFYYDNVVVHLQ